MAISKCPDCEGNLTQINPNQKQCDGCTKKWSRYMLRKAGA